MHQTAANVAPLIIILWNNNLYIPYTSRHGVNSRQILFWARISLRYSKCTGVLGEWLQMTDTADSLESCWTGVQARRLFDSYCLAVIDNIHEPFFDVMAHSANPLLDPLLLTVTSQETSQE